jgi:iron complex transport system substrate-binding protein
MLLGAAAQLAAAPRRIISIAPTVTEILYGVGVFDRVVAVSEFCTYPPAVKSLPRVGGWHTPNLEKLVGLRPDLVVMTDAQVPFILDQLQQVGIQTLVVQDQSVEDTFHAIDVIGKAVGKEREAAALAASTRAALERVRARARTLPHPTVLCVVDRTPGTLRDLYAATRGSFLAELLEAAGAKLVAAPARTGYGRISKETVLALNPDIILDMAHGSQAKSDAELKLAWRDLPELKAVRTGRIYEIKDDFVPHASQFIAKTAVLFARLLHPEVPARDWEAR